MLPLKLKIIAVIFFGCCLAMFGAFAEPYSESDLNWLKKMAHTSRQANYSGTFIYQSGNYVETSRLTHLYEGGNEHERLEGLDGERSEVIRKNGRIWCYQGDSKRMVAKRDNARIFPGLIPEQFLLLQENYSLRHGEEERVAGHLSRSITFYPKDKMRYSHKMWAHSNSGLLLKAVVLDNRDQIVEQYTFTQMNLGGEIDRKWIAQYASMDKVESTADASVQNQNASPVESGWVVYAIPAGFKKITEVTRHLRGKKSPVIHLVYSDGLAGISVFIEDIGENAGSKRGLMGNGLTQVYTKVLGGHLLTVVGEVPSRTVMQVADSVRNGGQK